MLFGMPRSGTTWVGKLFDSHPDTLYRHEPDSVNTMRDIPLAAEPEVASEHRDRLKRFYADIAGMTNAKTSGQMPLFPKSYLRAGAHTAQRIWVVAGKVGERLLGGWPMLSFASAKALANARLVWKSIESISRVGVMLDAAPDARCVLILRHPCGQIASRLQGMASSKFDSDVAAENDWGVFEHVINTKAAQRYGLTKESLLAMAPEERLAWNWVVFNEKALDDVEAMGLNDRVHVLVYEQLCANPERVLRQLFEFSGLPWNGQTQRFVDASTGQHSDSYYSVFKDPLKAAYSWQSKLTAKQISLVQGVLEQSRLSSYYPEA